jgi:16S rRNA processing protein RimM
VDDEQTANSLIKKEIFLPLDLLPPLEGTQFYYHEVLDFKVFDGQHLIGSIVGFQDNQGQDLLEVQDKEQKKILIPVHDDFIHTLNRKKKEMVINLPEGFLDLF